MNLYSKQRNSSVQQVVPYASLDLQSQPNIQQMFQDFAQEFESKIEQRIKAIEEHNHEFITKANEDIKLLDK